MPIITVNSDSNDNTSILSTGDVGQNTTYTIIFTFWNNELIVQMTGSLITNEWLLYSEWPSVYCNVTEVNTNTQYALVQ